LTANTIDGLRLGDLRAPAAGCTSAAPSASAVRPLKTRRRSSRHEPQRSPSVHIQVVTEGIRQDRRPDLGFILDAILAQDPVGRVACETLVTTGLAMIAARVTTSATRFPQDRPRDDSRRLATRAPSMASTCDTCASSPRSTSSRRTIAMGWTPRAGPGMMFGYACTETAS